MKTLAQKIDEIGLKLSDLNRKAHMSRFVFKRKYYQARMDYLHGKYTRLAGVTYFYSRNFSTGERKEGNNS